MPSKNKPSAELGQNDLMFSLLINFAANSKLRVENREISTTFVFLHCCTTAECACLSLRLCLPALGRESHGCPALSSILHLSARGRKTASRRVARHTPWVLKYRQHLQPMRAGCVLRTRSWIPNEAGWPTRYSQRQTAA